MTALQDISVDSIDDEPTSLAEFAGSVLLVVNVASKCGLTPQYEGLEALYQRYHDDGLVVLGFPANNFGGQEPGTNDEIAEFCSTNYSVSFPAVLQDQRGRRGPAPALRRAHLEGTYGGRQRRLPGQPA